MIKHYRQQVMAYPRYTSTALTRRRREILYGAARACRFRTRIGTSTNPITLTTRTASICMLSTKMARGTTTNATSLCLQFAKEVRSMAHTCDIMYIFICVAYARIFTLSHLSYFTSLSLKKWSSQKYFTLFDFLLRKWSFGALSGIMNCAAVCFVVALSEMCHATLGSSCYFILRRKLFVHHARSRCQDYGGHLAIIHNKEENALIQGLAKG